MTIDSHHLAAIESLRQWDALAGWTLGFDTDHRGAADHLEVDLDDVRGDVVGALLADLLEVDVLASVSDSSHRAVVLGVMTTGGPHIEFSRQTWNGRGPVTVSTFWSGERHTTVTLPYLASVLDDLAESMT